jgi:ketosteroid isomerase-like protein
VIAKDAVVALPCAGPENGPRMVARGRPNAVALLTSEALRWGVPRTTLHCALGDAHYLEGAVTTSRAAAEVTASARVASAQVTGLLVYRHPPVPRPHGPSTRRVPDPSLAEDAVRRYLANLESGQMAAAASCFTLDAVYSYPPRGPDGARGVAMGRAAIHEAFLARGTNTARHQIRTVAVADDGAQYVIDGRVVGLPGGATANFLSSVSISDEGQITRYVTRMSSPEVLL